MKKTPCIPSFLIWTLCLGSFGPSIFPCLDEKVLASETHSPLKSIESIDKVTKIVTCENLSDSEEYEKLLKEIRRLLEEIKRLERETKDKFNEEILPIIRRKLKRLRKLLEEFNLEDDPSKDDDMILT
jgi:hypothetical protein